MRRYKRRWIVGVAPSRDQVAVSCLIFAFRIFQTTGGITRRRTKHLEKVLTSADQPES